MATVNETVADLLRNYPAICKNRLQALAQIFCCGSGYDLVDGEMVSSFPMEDRPYQDRFRKSTVSDFFVAETATDPALHELHQRIQMETDLENMRIKFVIDNAERLAALRFHRNDLGDCDDLALNRVPYISHWDGRYSDSDVTELNDEWQGALLELCWAFLEEFDAGLMSDRNGPHPQHDENQRITAQIIIEKLTGKTVDEHDEEDMNGG